MEKKNHKAFVERLWQLKTKAQQHAALKDYMLSLSFDELIEWNAQNFDESQKSIDALLKKGVTDDDRTWFGEQFAKFDDLERTIRGNAAAWPTRYAGLR